MSPWASSLSFALMLAACNAPSAPTPTAPASDASSGPAPSAAAAPSSSAYLAALQLLAPSPSSNAPIPLSPRGTEALEASLRVATFFASSAPKTAVVEDTFLIAAGDKAAPVDKAAALTQQTMAALYNGPLRHRPETATLVWLCSTDASYADNLKTWAPGEPTDDIGVYLPDWHVIVVNTGRATIFSLNHEVAHVLVDADFPHAPVWLQEGVASWLELPLFRPDGSVASKPDFRLQTLRDALASPKAAPDVRLDALFALTTPESFRAKGKEALNYALARESLRWLDSARHQLWAFYSTWRRDILTDPTGEKSFTSVTGASPVAASPEFVAWIKSNEAAQ